MAQRAGVAGAPSSRAFSAALSAGLRRKLGLFDGAGGRRRAGPGPAEAHGRERRRLHADLPRGSSRDGDAGARALFDEPAASMPGPRAGASALARSRRTPATRARPCGRPTRSSSRATIASRRRSRPRRATATSPRSRNCWRCSPRPFEERPEFAAYAEPPEPRPAGPTERSAAPDHRLVGARVSSRSASERHWRCAISR